MTGQNDRQDESLTGQVHDQAGHCPLTGRYFEPCLNDKPDDNVLEKMWNCDNSVTNFFANFVITIQPKTVSDFCSFT